MIFVRSDECCFSGPWTGCGVTTVVAGCLLALGEAALGRAGAPSPTLAAIAPIPLERDFLIRSWRPEHGVPDDRVLALLAARDGFLWVGTRKGVTRFDGSRFVTWSRSTDAAFRSEECRALTEDRDGVVWVGTADRGVVQMIEPPIRHEPERIPEHHTGNNPGFLNYTCSLHATPAGELLVGTVLGLVTRSPDGIWAHENTAARAEFPPISALAQGREGTVWVGTVHQLFRRERAGAPWVRELEGKNDRYTRCVHGLGLTPDGVMHALVGSWPGGTGYLLQRQADGWQPLLDRELRNFSQPLFLAADADGGLWFPITGRVIGRWHAGRLTEYTLPAELGTDVFLCLAEDAEGNLWAGTSRHGLFCLQPRRIRTLTKADGLPDPDTWSLLETSDGGLWVGTQEGVARFKPGEGDSFTEPATVWPGRIRALAEDREGRVWIGTGAGLFRWDGRQVERVEYAGEPHRYKIRALLAGRDGAVWAGTAQGLYCFRDGETKAWQVADGLPHESVCVILEDRARQIWIGTDGGGLARLTNTDFERFDEARGLSSLRVWALIEDENEAGTIWIGTDRGLNVLRHGRIAAITTVHGLPDNLVNGVVTDRRGGLWVGQDRGIYRASRAELLEVIEGRRAQVNCVTYTEQDGLPDLETNGQISYPPVIQLRDGRVAFATVAGVALFDPDALPDLTTGPPVHIQSLRAGATSLFPSGPAERALGAARRTATGHVTPDRVRLRPAERVLVDLHYTAISFRSPDQTRFRYRLLGLSPEWVDAGGLRQATYANLRPGTYTFEVVAANHHGHWSANPARLDLEVAPRWHERLTVRLAGALGLLVVVAGAVRWRLEQQRRLARLVHQAALARHRARLAKDLHDGLGANLTEITLLTGVGETQSRSPDDLAQRFNRLASTAHEALHSLRDIIWSTTPKADSLEALVSRLCESTERATEAAGLRCRFQFPPELPAVVLGPELRKDLLFAVNEVIHNGIRHAHATEVRIRFRIEDRWLQIEIEDDGQGFAVTEIAQRRAAPDRGLGLASVRERVLAHSGTCELRSQPGHGTTLTLRVPLPAHIAVEDASGPS